LIERGSAEFIERVCREHLDEGGVGFIGHTPMVIDDASFSSIQIGERAEDYAYSIYPGLRELDKKAPAVIVVEGLSGDGRVVAVMDRLRRAASDTGRLREFEAGNQK
jgi:hypothetical protein